MIQCRYLQPELKQWGGLQGILCATRIGIMPIIKIQATKNKISKPMRKTSMPKDPRHRGSKIGSINQKRGNSLFDWLVQIYKSILTFSEANNQTMGDEQDQDSYEQYKKYLEDSLGIPSGISPPPKPLSPYMRFFFERTCEEKSKGNNNFVEFTKIISEEWKKLDAKKKQYYQKMYEINLRQKKQIQEEYDLLTKNKKTVNGYTLFYKKRYGQITKDQPKSDTKIISQMISQEWKNLSPADKEKYKKSALTETENQDLTPEEKAQRIESYNEKVQQFQQETKEYKQKILKKYGLHNLKQKKMQEKRKQREKEREAKRLEKEQQRKKAEQEKKNKKREQLEEKKKQKQLEKKQKEEQNKKQNNQSEKKASSKKVNETKEKPANLSASKKSKGSQKKAKPVKAAVSKKAPRKAVEQQPAPVDNKKTKLIKKQPKQAKAPAKSAKKQQKGKKPEAKPTKKEVKKQVKKQVKQQVKIEPKAKAQPASSKSKPKRK